MVNYCSDSLCIKGNSYDALEKAIRGLSEATEIRIVGKNKVSFMALTKNPWDDKFSFYNLNEESLDEFEMFGEISKRVTLDKELDIEFKQEIMNGTGLLAKIGEENVLVSPIAIKQLCQNYGVGGDAIIKDNSFTRNLIIARSAYVKTGIMNDHKKLSFVIRNNEKMNKLVSVLSNAELQKADIVLDLIKELPDYYTVSEFKITQSLTEIILVKGDKALKIINSDIGASSLIVQTGILLNGAFIYADAVSRKHYGEIKVKDFVDRKVYPMLTCDPFDDFSRLYSEQVSLNAFVAEIGLPGILRGNMDEFMDNLAPEDLSYGKIIEAVCAELLSADYLLDYAKEYSFKALGEFMARFLSKKAA